MKNKAHTPNTHTLAILNLRSIFLKARRDDQNEKKADQTDHSKK